MADTIERAYRAWHENRGPRGEPLPWLLLIAKRLVIDRARRRRLARVLAFLPMAPQVDQTLDESEERMWFEQLAAVMTPRQFEALVLRYLMDLSDAQMARVLGLSASGSRALLGRAIGALRAHPEVLR